MKIERGYEPLAEVLVDALNQAQHGKGRIRHANHRPFVSQPIMSEGRELGPAGPAFQARKKIRESINCLEDDRAIEDLLGAIVYTAALVLLRREHVEQDLRRNAPGTAYTEYIKPPPLPCSHKSTKAIKKDAHGNTTECNACGLRTFNLSDPRSWGPASLPRY